MRSSSVPKKVAVSTPSIQAGTSSVPGSAHSLTTFDTSRGFPEIPKTRDPLALTSTPPLYSVLMPKKAKGPRFYKAHETPRMDELNSLPLATFQRRFYAIAIDFVLIAIIKSVLHIGGHHEIEARQGSFAWFVLEAKDWLAEILESTVFFAVLLKLGKGQTPGKWLMKIRVLSLTHRELGWWQSIERALGYGASLLEGGFGFFQYFLNRNRMTVHDRIAETIVVHWPRGAHQKAVLHPEANTPAPEPDLPIQQEPQPEA
jgi:uncharacterized RDD family membrane protein YckC